MGTDEEGLFRYDGLQFHNIRMNESRDESKSIQANFIKTMVADPNGNIWVATDDGYISIYYPATGTFRHFKFRSEEIRFPIIDHLILTKGGRAWISSQNYGLFYLDTLDGYISKFISPDLQTIGTSSGLMQLSDTSFLFVSKGVLHEMVNGKLRKSWTLAWNEEKTDNVYTSLERDPYGRIWMGSRGKGVFIFDPVLGKIVQHLPFTGANSDFRPGMVSKLYLDKKQRMWVGTEYGVLLIRQPVIGRYEIHHILNEHKIGILADNRISCFLEDKSGILWIGTATGINKYDEDKLKFIHLLALNTPSGAILNDNYIFGISEDEKGALWLGTLEGYLLMYNRTTETIRQYLLPSEIEKSANSIYDIHQLPDDNLLIASQQGVYIFDKSREIFLRHSSFPHTYQGRPIKYRQLLPVGDKIFAASTRGVGEYNQRTGEFTPHLVIPYQDDQKKYPGRKTLPDRNSVKAIELDEEGNLWAANDYGICLFDFSTGELRQLPLPVQPDVQFPYDEFIALSLHKSGPYLWLGTYKSGILRMNANFMLRQQGQPEMRFYTRENGLSNNVINCITSDADGNIWVSTNNGISSISTENEAIYNFDLSDGLQDKEFNMGAVLRTKSGEVIFGGINGINVFYPRNIKPNTFMPDVLFTNMNILSRPDPAGREWYKTLSLIGKNEVILESDENFFSIRFIANQYANPLKNTFAYRMDAFDKDWIYLEPGVNQATYTNLPPGTYIFKVRVANYDLQWNPQEYSIRIHVLSPLWQQSWFIVSCILSIGLMIFLLVRQNVRRHNKTKRYLELQVHKRTREVLRQKKTIELQNIHLKKAHDDLMRMNAKKDTIFSILSHDLRSPLTTLQGFLGILSQLIQLDNKNEVHYHAEKIRNAVGSSLDLLDNILFWSQAEMESLKFKAEPINVSELSTRTVELYRLATDLKKIEVNLAIPADLSIYADFNMMFLVMRNLLSNAIKFTISGGNILISAHQTASHVIISVKDSGIGMSEEEVQRLFRQTEGFSKRGTANEKGMGIGFGLCRKFIEKNNGQIKVSSQPGQGSNFEILLPRIQRKIGFETSRVSTIKE